MTKYDELHTDTAVVVVGRVALALIGARMTPTTHASIAERDDIEVGLNHRRVATLTGGVASFVTA
jgi:hypothetical protein